MNTETSRAPVRTAVHVMDFVPHGRRTAEQFFLGVASQLRIHGWRSVFVFGGEPGAYLADGLRDLGDVWMVTRFQPSPREAFSLGMRLRKYRPDALHAHFMSKFSLPLPLLKFASGARVLIVNDHSSGFAPRRTGLARQLMRLRGRMTGLYIDHLVAVSEFIRRRDVDDMGMPSRIARVIHNGADLDRFIAEAGDEQAEPTIAFVGSLKEEKGTLTLLTAFKALLEGADAHQSLRLKIAGEGPQEAELKAFCAAHGISSRVDFLGQVSTVPALFGTATVAVVPSQYGEACATVLPEAMAAGACMLVSDDGGAPEVVGPSGEAAVIFRAGDVVDFERKLRELLGDPDQRRRLRRAARIRAQQFTLARAVNAHAAMYAEIAVQTHKH